VATEPEYDDADEHDDDAVPADQASQTPTPGVRVVPRRPLPEPSRVSRFAFYALWLFAAPAALALLSVKLLEPERDDFEAGALRTFVGEQQVPATILFFTLFAMVIWRLRHVLPLALATGMVARRDVPARTRARYEQASHLIEEARRLIEATRKDKRAPSADERRRVEAGIAALEDTMLALDFDEDAFLRAHDAAHELVHEHLGRWRKSELREYTESIGFAVAVALVLRFFVIEAFKIPTGSMIPTLMIGDHIFVAKYAYGPLLPRSDSRLYSNLPPKRGDVMVFKFPENKAQDFIKRTVAIPGDSLEVIDGRPIINGLLLPHCYVGKLESSLGVRGHLYLEYSGDAAYLTMFNEKQDELRCDQDLDCTDGRQCRAHVCGIPQGPYRVMPGEAWVFGDNRDNSHDSRAWHLGMGAGVPFENIKGKAMFVWWSWDPRGGLGWDRLGVNVMGTPKLPQGADALVPALETCLKNRPPLADTTPPLPR